MSKKPFLGEERTYSSAEDTAAQAGCDTRSIFLAEFNKFEFKVFLFLYWLPY